MKLYKQTKRFLLLLVILSAVTFADAQNETKAYQVSGIVPEGVDKIYIYKSIGLGQREMIDSVAVSNSCFTMSGPRPSYDLLSIGSGAMGIQFFNDGEPLRIDFVRGSLSASPLNERFYRYCKEGTRFTDEFYRLFIAMKQAGDETRKREFERQMAANDEASREFERNIIHDNRDNVIAAYYLNELCSFMDFDELSECLDSTVSYYNHPPAE